MSFRALQQSLRAAGGDPSVRESVRGTHTPGCEKGGRLSLVERCPRCGVVCGCVCPVVRCSVVLEQHPLTRPAASSQWLVPGPTYAEWVTADTLIVNVYRMEQRTGGMHNGWSWGLYCTPHQGGQLAGLPNACQGRAPR